MNRIFCIGNVSVDFVVVTDSTDLKILHKEIILPRGGKIDALEMLHFVGGSATNIAQSLKASGNNVRIYSQIGNDESAQIIKQSLKNAKISHEFYVSKSSPSANSLILNYQKDRTIFSCASDSDYNNWEPKDFSNLDWVVIGPLHGECSKLIDKIISAMVKYKFRLALIPSNYLLTEGTSTLRRILKVTDLYISNIDEGRTLVHQNSNTEKKRLCATISQYGPRVVAITNGALGAVIYSEDIYFDLPAIENIALKDTTGAGDAFAGGLISTLSQSKIMDKKSILAGLNIGLLNSSKVLSEYGASNGILNNKEFKSEFKKYDVG